MILLPARVKKRRLTWTASRTGVSGAFRRGRLYHGRYDLAQRVEWVSSSRGDGLGYDILSSNEVRVLEQHQQAYHLYWVFGLSRDPRLYVLQGAYPRSAIFCRRSIGRLFDRSTSDRPRMRITEGSSRLVYCQRRLSDLSHANAWRLNTRPRCSPKAALVVPKSIQSTASGTSCRRFCVP